MVTTTFTEELFLKSYHAMKNNVVAVTYTRILVRVLGLTEKTIAPLLLGTTLKPEDIYGNVEFISLHEQYKIVDNAVKLPSEPGLGLAVGAMVDLSSHGLIGIAALSSDTLLDALAVLAKFYILRAPFIEFMVDKKMNEVVVQVKNRDSFSEDVSRYLLESVIAMLQTVCEQFIGRKLQEGKIIFSYPEPHYVERYKKVLHSPTVFVEQEYCQYWIPLELTKISAPTKDQSTHRQAEQSCLEALARLQKKSSYSDRVKDVLCIQDGTFLSLPAVASLLNASPRSLIRKLKEEGTSYQKLLDEEHKRLSIHYLNTSKISIEAIAFAMGYEYVANFRRAFKRWYGITPSDYRKQLLDGGYSHGLDS